MIYNTDLVRQLGNNTADTFVDAILCEASNEILKKQLTIKPM